MLLSALYSHCLSKSWVILIHISPLHPPFASSLWRFAFWYHHKLSSVLGECEAGIYLVEKKEEKRENRIGGRSELLWAGGDHCNLQKRKCSSQHICDERACIGNYWKLSILCLFCEFSPEHCPPACQGLTRPLRTLNENPESHPHIHPHLDKHPHCHVYICRPNFHPNAQWYTILNPHLHNHSHFNLSKILSAQPG